MLATAIHGRAKFRVMYFVVTGWIRVTDYDTSILTWLGQQNSIAAMLGTVFYR